MNNYTKTVNGNLQGQHITIKELSFYEYRTLVKRLLTDDVNAINDAFNALVNNINLRWLHNDYNIVAKFNILLQLRSVILSPVIEMSVNDTQVNYPISEILNVFNKPSNTFKYTHDQNVYEFGLPSSFAPHTNPIEFVTDCLVAIDGQEVGFNLDELPALPFNEITQGIIKFYEDYRLVLPHINQELNPFDGSILMFLKSIFLYNIKDLYDIEYALRRNLNFQSYDFETLSLPECNILLKHLNDDVKQTDKQVES